MPGSPVGSVELENGSWILWVGSRVSGGKDSSDTWVLWKCSSVSGLCTPDSPRTGVAQGVGLICIDKCMEVDETVQAGAAEPVTIKVTNSPGQIWLILSSG